MALMFDPEEAEAWLAGQILSVQIDWMDCYKAGDDAGRVQQEAILDGIYAFRQYFLAIPSPAPGQGYQPPIPAWKSVVRDRKLEDIDAKISDLMARREAILNDDPEA